MTNRIFAFILFMLSCAGIASGGERTVVIYRPAFEGQSAQIGSTWYRYTDDPRRAVTVGHYQGVPIGRVLYADQAMDRLSQQGRSVYALSDETLELVTFQDRAISVPDEYGRVTEAEIVGHLQRGEPSLAAQLGQLTPVNAFDDETVGTLPATTGTTAPPPTPQVITTKWKSGAFEQEVKTPRRDNEANGAWARRHKEAVEAQALEFPPNAN